MYLYTYPDPHQDQKLDALTQLYMVTELVLQPDVKIPGRIMAALIMKVSVSYI